MYKINSDTIDFFWDSDRIFDVVSYKTGIKAKDVADDENSNADETYNIITDDKVEFVIESLRPIFISLYKLFLDISIDAPNTIFVHEPSAELGMFVSGFSISCWRNRADKLVVKEQRLNTVSSLCQEYVISEIIKKWYEDKDLKELAKISSDESAKILIELEENAKFLKKRAYERSYI